MPKFVHALAFVLLLLPPLANAQLTTSTLSSWQFTYRHDSGENAATEPVTVTGTLLGYLADDGDKIYVAEISTMYLPGSSLLDSKITLSNPASISVPFVSISGNDMALEALFSSGGIKFLASSGTGNSAMVEDNACCAEEVVWSADNWSITSDGNDPYLSSGKSGGGSYSGGGSSGGGGVKVKALKATKKTGLGGGLALPKNQVNTFPSFVNSADSEDYMSDSSVNTALASVDVLSAAASGYYPISATGGKLSAFEPYADSAATLEKYGAASAFGSVPEQGGAGNSGGVQKAPGSLPQQDGHSDGGGQTGTPSIGTPSIGIPSIGTPSTDVPSFGYEAPEDTTAQADEEGSDAVDQPEDTTGNAGNQGDPGGAFDAGASDGLTDAERDDAIHAAGDGLADSLDESKYLSSGPPKVAAVEDTNSDVGQSSSNAIPLPSTLYLFGVALAGLGALRGRAGQNRCRLRHS